MIITKSVKNWVDQLDSKSIYVHHIIIIIIYYSGLGYLNLFYRYVNIVYVCAWLRFILFFNWKVE